MKRLLSGVLLLLGGLAPACGTYSAPLDDDSSVGGGATVTRARSPGACTIGRECNWSSMSYDNGSCSTKGGVYSAHCASTELYGCCLFTAGDATCYYGEDNAALQSQSMQDGQTWTTTAP